jgi:hypothetical protein
MNSIDDLSQLRARAGSFLETQIIPEKNEDFDLTDAFPGKMEEK